MKAFFAVAIAAIFFALPAIAQDTSVSIPVGEILGYILPSIGLLLFGGVLWIAKTLSPSLYAILRTAQTEQLLARAISYGINATHGATKGKALNFKVGNEVARNALQFTLTHGGAWVKEFAGDPILLAEKIYSRLDLEEWAEKPDFAILADEALNGDNGAKAPV